MSSAFIHQTWSLTRLATNLLLSPWVTGKAPHLALSYWHNPAILGLTFGDANSHLLSIPTSWVQLGLAPAKTFTLFAHVTANYWDSRTIFITPLPRIWDISQGMKAVSRLRWYLWLSFVLEGMEPSSTSISAKSSCDSEVVTSLVMTITKKKHTNCSLAFLLLVSLIISLGFRFPSDLQVVINITTLPGQKEGTCPSWGFIMPKEVWYI